MPSRPQVQTVPSIQRMKDSSSTNRCHLLPLVIALEIWKALLRLMEGFSARISGTWLYS